MTAVPTAAARASLGEPAPALGHGVNATAVEKADEGVVQRSGRPHLARRLGPGHGSSPAVPHRAVGGGKGRRPRNTGGSKPPPRHLVDDP